MQAAVPAPYNGPGRVERTDVLCHRICPVPVDLSHGQTADVRWLSTSGKAERDRGAATPPSRGPRSAPPNPSRAPTEPPPARAADMDEVAQHIRELPDRHIGSRVPLTGPDELLKQLTKVVPETALD